MTTTTRCLLIIYKNGSGQCASELTSQYCCLRLQRELLKTPAKKKYRHSIGGIHKMDDKPDAKGHWLKRCPYCNAKITIKTIILDKIPYEFIVKQECMA